MMDFAVNFPLLTVVVSLMAAVICSVLPWKAARALAVTVISACLCMSFFVLLRGILTGESVTYLMSRWPAPWGNEFRFGILEPLFCTLFGTILLLCLLGGNQAFEEDAQGRLHLYFTMLLLVQASLSALCYTNDIFTGYVFVEICTLSSCGILIIRGSGRSITAATRYMIFSLMGSGLFLLGVILLYDVTGHLLMPQIRESFSVLWSTGEYRMSLRVIVSLIVVGLAIKSGLFPFHFWMADTYAAALPGSAGVLSGIISKGYIILLIKIVFSVFGTETFYASGAQNVLFAFGVLGMVVGSVSAIRQTDIKRMVAFSSAAQIGYIYMGIGISPEAGMLAAMFHILTHALTKPPLFLAAGRLCEASGGSRNLEDLKGAAHRDPAAGFSFTVGALSMVGLPALMGFVSKILFATAGVQAGNKMLPTLIALALSTVLNVVYFLRAVLRIYTSGETADQTRDARRVAWLQGKTYLAVAVIFAAMNVALGLHAQPVINLLARGLRLLG